MDRILGPRIKWVKLAERARKEHDLNGLGPVGMDRLNGWSEGQAGVGIILEDA